LNTLKSFKILMADGEFIYKNWLKSKDFKVFLVQLLLSLYWKIVLLYEVSYDLYHMIIEYSESVKQQIEVV
jgi:hypothetical protein